MDTGYKVSTRLHQNSLESRVRNVIGDDQGDFMKNRSTANAIHMIKEITEKAHEYKMPICRFQAGFRLIEQRKNVCSYKRGKRITNCGKENLELAKTGNTQKRRTNR